MRHGKKPTSAQKKALSRNGADPAKFLFIGSAGDGWRFADRDDDSRLIVCYPDRKGIYGPDGETLIEIE